MRRATPVLLMAAAAAMVGCADRLWHRGSFESALELARSGETMVMVEFQTDW